MTITATVIADSISPTGDRITTMQLRYPRFIHAEFMTHRVFSRNASSSRAIPIERMIQDVIDDPAMPVVWGSNKPGMQAGKELHFYAKKAAIAAWLGARDQAVAAANVLRVEGAHKQIVNRLLEPFGHISVICTATEWDNFFELRCHPDADPTMRALAEAMRDAISGSEPREDDWHLPYIDSRNDYRFVANAADHDEAETFRIAAMISAARCARVSYLNHDGSEPDIAKDLALADRLLTSKHMSPFEHQAKLPNPNNMDTWLWGNFTGWDQYRKLVEVRPDET